MAKKPKYERMPKPAVKEKAPHQRMTPDVTDEHCLAIGKVVVAWAKLEAALQAIIWDFLSLGDDEGRLLTGRLDARPKIEMLAPLAEKFLPDGAVATSFFEALGRISELADDRNFVVHGVWGTWMPDNVPIASSLRPKSVPGRVIAETFPRERMAAMLHDISVAHRIVTDLPVQLAALRGRRRTLRPQGAATPQPSRKEGTQPKRRRPPKS